MEDWKDIIAQRLRDRSEKILSIERMLNRIEVTLDNLLEELSAEYQIRAKYKTKYTKENEPFWIVNIEDVIVELNSNNFFIYLKNSDGNIKDALIRFILDNFTFTE